MTTTALDTVIRAGCEALHPSPEGRARFPCHHMRPNDCRLSGGCDLHVSIEAALRTALAEAPELIRAMMKATWLTKGDIRDEQRASLAALRKHYGLE